VSAEENRFNITTIFSAQRLSFYISALLSHPRTPLNEKIFSSNFLPHIMARIGNARRPAGRKVYRRPGSYGLPVAAITTAVGSAVGKYLKPIFDKEFEKPSNSDTAINLNSNFNSTSLYSKSRSKRKPLSKVTRKRRLTAKKFTRKVKKCITKSAPWSTYTWNTQNYYAINNTPNANLMVQDVWGAGTLDSKLMVGYGAITDPATTDVSHITAILESYGHVENGVVATPPNLNLYKFYFKCRVELDIWCQNTEITDNNPLYVDIYECVANRNITDAAYASPGAAWTQCHANNSDHATVTVDTTDYPNSRGSIPSAAPGFSKYWKVCQVTRIRIATKAPYHYKYYTQGLWDPMKYAQTYAVKGITKGLVLVGSPVVTLTLPATWDVRLGGVSKHFTFKESPRLGVTPMMDLKNTRFVT
jgi:hypothetical protein